MDLRELQNTLRKRTLEDPSYTIRDGILMYRGRFLISKDSKLKALLLQEFHDTLVGGLVGVERTFLRLNANFFWKGMRNDVKEFVTKCITCQTIKYSTASPNGLLQPLEMPERVWEDLALDFIVGLPNS